MLLAPLAEERDLPAHLVALGDPCGGRFKLIARQHERGGLVGARHHDALKRLSVVVFSLPVRRIVVKPHDLSGADRPGLRRLNGVRGLYVQGGIALETGHERALAASISAPHVALIEDVAGRRPRAQAQTLFLRSHRSRGAHSGCTSPGAAAARS